MKAAILTHYDKRGTDLSVQDLAIPVPKNDEVLVKIKAAGVNPLDNMIIRGEVKLIVPYKTPLVMGNECAGVVEKVGKDVAGFKPGDRVYGRMPLKKIGAFAEYAAVQASALAHIPEYMSFEAAATVPLTALTAMQAFEIMQAKAGESVFISGGTGSLGAMAIPVAKSYGLTVITNGNGASEERVRRLGADRFIDYKKEDYAKVLSNVDYVLDTLGDRELEKEFSILKDGGSLVSLRGMPNGEFAARTGMWMIKRLLLKVAGRKYDQLAARRNQKYYFIFVHEDGAALERISEIFGQNHLQASVDGVFSLDDANEALKKVASGGSKGKTILRIAE